MTEPQKESPRMPNLFESLIPAVFLMAAQRREISPVLVTCKDSSQFQVPKNDVIQEPPQSDKRSNTYQHVEIMIPDGDYT